MKIPIYIVNFNTTELTNNAILTIIANLHSFDYTINIFDNSTARKFEKSIDIDVPINVIDNTKGQIIDFNRILNESVDVNHYQQTHTMNTSQFGTLKHTYTIDYIIQNLVEKDFILFDSDIELKRDIDFIDDQYVTIAGINHTEPTWPDRFFPFIQYFNVQKIKSHNIRYFDKNRILFGNDPQNNLRYDTGGSFCEDVKLSNLPYKEIDYTKYINHLGGGSFNKDKISIPSQSYGDFTYGNPIVVGDDSGAKLKVGKFCSIAGGVKIFLGLNHRTDWVTTYPFCSPVIPTRDRGNICFQSCQHLQGHSISKGDVIIGNDVWIGDNATILSGVKIGDGAVIAANTTVVKDVAPYTIVAGNPGKCVKQRFANNVIDKLLHIKWWNLPLDTILKLAPYMLSNNINHFFDKYEEISK